MTLRSRRREDALARDLANFLFKRATFSSEKRTYTTVDSVVRLAASQLKGQIGDNLEVYPICAERVVRLAAQYYAELCHSAEESSDNSNSPTPPTCMENVNSCPDQAFLQHNRQQECSSFSLFDYLDQQAVRSNMAEHVHMGQDTHLGTCSVGADIHLGYTPWGRAYTLGCVPEGQIHT